MLFAPRSVARMEEAVEGGGGGGAMASTDDEKSDTLLLSSVDRGELSPDPSLSDNTEPM